MHIISINPGPARDLVGEMRHAASTVGKVERDLEPLLVEAVSLIGGLPDVTGLLGVLSEDLSDDAKDLEWRIDYLEASDRAVPLPEGRIGGRMHEPTMTASELAEAFRNVLAADDHLRRDDLDTILDGLKAYTRHDSGDPEWDEVVDFWNDDLDDNELRSDLADVADRLNRIDITLADVAFLLDELEAHSAQPRFLAQVFNDLGPEATLDLTETISILAYTDALSSRNHGPDFDIDPITMRTTLSNALGDASHGTRPNPRQEGRLDLLSDYWFDRLFEHGIETHDVLFGSDRVIVHDGLPALFADGDFRTDVAAKAGIVGMQILNHEVTVERGAASPLYPGFAELETAWESRGGMLVQPATADPRAAATVLAHEYGDGRTGVEVIADGDFDNMQHDRVGAIYGPLVFSGTVEAERLAVTDGIVTDPDLLQIVFGNKKSLFDTIEGHRADVEYGPELTMAFAHVVADTLPHVMVVEAKVDPGFVAISGEPVPSDWSGIHISSEELKWVLGALFQNDDAREYLGVEIAFVQRAGLLENASPRSFNKAGELAGAWINGYNVASIERAQDAEAEIAAINAWVDRGWSAVEITADLVPGGGTALKVVGHVNDALDLVGEGPLHTYLHRSGSEVAGAEAQAESRVFASHNHARRFVFDRAFTLMQAELSVSDGDTEALSPTSAAIFELVMDSDHMPDITLGETTIHELESLPNGENALNSLAGSAAARDGVLFVEFGSFREGLSEAHPELSVR